MNMYDNLKLEIIEAYHHHRLDRPFIVAIDGLGGAGEKPRLFSKD